MDLQIRKTSADAAREIKASAHYQYVVGGITLDGSKFADGALVLEGTCLMKDDASGMYEPYADDTGAWPTGKSDPVILDESIKFTPKDDASNPDVTAGQVLVHGSVYNGMLVGVTASFRAKNPMIRYV